MCPGRSLSSDLRKALGRVIQEAREIAEAGAAESLDAMGVGAASPHVHMSADERTLRNQLRSRGRQAGDRRNRGGSQQVEHLVQEVAYAHWHRMLFARFLAENGLLIAPGHGVAVSLEDCQALAREEGRSPWELAGEWAGGLLPEVFLAGDPALALSLSPESSQELEGLLESLPDEVFTARDSLGWTYQYWRAKEKDRINKSGVKIGADELPAVTQLFTERYMVLFLLHNTIGAWRAGKMLAAEPGLANSAPDEAALREAMRLAAAGGYDFEYLRFVRTGAEDKEVGPAEDEERNAGPWRPAAGDFSDWPRAARGIRVLDPCCGSGHFLVEILELLARLRMEAEGLSIREAVRAVLRDNLFGLEIDPRCAQIAAFNVAMSAWRLAGKWIALPRLNVACSGMEPVGSEDDWVRLVSDLNSKLQAPSSETLRLEEGIRHLYRLFREARTLGSLIDPEGEEGDLLRSGFSELQGVLDTALETRNRRLGRSEAVVAAAGMARAVEILRQHYTLVTTNVPFLGRGRQSAAIRGFADAFYKAGKADLATVFLTRIFRWLGRKGSQALITPQEWLFLKSFRKLRERLLKSRTWNGFVRLGEGAFQDAAGRSSALVILSKSQPKGTCMLAGLDASSSFLGPPIRAAEKAQILADIGDIVVSKQVDQARNPDAVITMRPIGELELLQRMTNGFVGLQLGDQPTFSRFFWETSLGGDSNSWVFFQSTVSNPVDFGGRERVVFWEGLEKAAKSIPSGKRHGIRIQGGGSLEP